MIETTLLLAPGRWATMPAPNLDAFLEQRCSVGRTPRCERRTPFCTGGYRSWTPGWARLRPIRRGRPRRIPHAPAKRRTPPSGRRRGRQPGRGATLRALLPVEQMDEVVRIVPEICRHGGRRNPAAVCALALFPSRRDLPPGAAPPAGPAPSPAGTVAPARGGEPGSQSGGALPRVKQVVGGAVDFRPY